MPLVRILTLAVACAVAALLALPGPSTAGEPPNGNDPCSTNGKNTCGTLGVGLYENYRYGIRWFGDYRGAVPGKAHTFCIDLRYWYPSRSFAYAQTATGPGFENREGETISLEKQRRMAYAVWTYGQSTETNQQAAMMLYVHSLMGDAAPGEVDPTALGTTVVSLYEKIARDASRYHGPYKIDVRIGQSLTIGAETTATIRVLSATGVALPNLPLGVKSDGASGVSRQTRTNDAGVATVTMTPNAADGVSLTVETPTLASTLPDVWTPTTPAAKRNGQRLVAPASQVVSRTVQARVAKTRIAIVTTATPSRLLLGQSVQDTVEISGASKDWTATVEARIYGPFRTEAAIRCDGTPAWEGTFTAKGPGTYKTKPVAPSEVGWYTYQEVVPGDAGNTGVTSPCNDPAERFKVETQPVVKTQVSERAVQPGTAITDKIVVSGLAGQPVTVNAALYGPFGSRETIVCDGTPIWTGKVDAAADGELTTEPFTPTVPGFYTYREWIDPTDFTRGASTACGEEAETTIVIGQPRIETQVSAQETAPGSTIADNAVVGGLGALSAPVEVELWGPFATKKEIACTGKPYWKGTFLAKGDGTYRTQPVTLEHVGYYTYRERILETPAYAGVETECGEAAETTLARATPQVTTLVSAEVVVPGGTISDRIRVTGLGRTPATIVVELFGPFASREAISCSGKPYWKGTVAAKGDGELRSAEVKVAKAGFYTYREKLAGSALVAATQTECGEAAETSLARPEIHTGRGEAAATARVEQAGGLAPARVRIQSLGIDAPIAPAGIDLGQGVLAVPSDIRRTGWWRDGAVPGAKTGATLIGGHVDSKVLGAGAFFRLKDAKRGARIEVTTAGGKTVAYRVVSVRTVVKAKLPADVYSLQGAHRLVLVTCGGPFQPSQKSYRDNVIVTAVPISG